MITRKLRTPLGWSALAVAMLVACVPALGQRTVTLQLNTATLADTTSTNAGTIEVRGCLDGDACVDNMSSLPDGNILGWGAETTLKPDNAGGDYWTTSFQIPDEVTMAFKFFSVQAEGDGASIGGWEDGDNHTLEAGTGDTTMVLHYFAKGDTKPYDWRPIPAKDDSIGVWFRVYMNTAAAVTGGYDRTSSTVGMRGAPDTGGQLDWGATNVMLAPESENEADPGYHIWSGAAYWPADSAGLTQPYKFIIGNDGWEGTISDRTFTIPDADSTVRYVFFDDDAAISGSGPVTGNVIFGVDLSPLETLGIFDRGRGDTLEVRGSFNGWGCGDPDACLMQRIPGEDAFEAAVSITAVPQSQQDYKFFLNFNETEFQNAFGEASPNGWEEPISTTGANRFFTFEGGSGDQDLGVQFFNDILPANIIPEGTSIDVMFSVNMDSALVNDAQPFNPSGGDSVFVNLSGDGIWAFTQGMPRDADGNFQLDPTHLLTDEDGDGVYTGTITVTGLGYGALQYQISYGQGGTVTTEAGGGFSGQGRRRTRYIKPNDDGTWPAEWAFELESFQAEGALPFEENPVNVAIEEFGSDIPTKVTLSDNYPNPFNPSTTFEFSIDKNTEIELSVFDLQGRRIETLIDGVRPAANYRVTFEAQGLASGVYFYRLTTPGQIISKQMVLIK